MGYAEAQERGRDVFFEEIGEDSQHQCKRMLESSDKPAAEICAFANSDGGGTLILGVEDSGKLSAWPRNRYSV